MTLTDPTAHRKDLSVNRGDQLATDSNYTECESRKAAQRYLKQIENIDTQVKSMIEEIGALQDKAFSIASVQADDIRVMTSQASDARFVGYLARKDEIEHDVDRKLARLLDLKMRIREVIAQVPDVKCQLVLRYRYIHLLSWPETQERLGLCERSVYNLHKRALSFVAEIMNAQDSIYLPA